jgi:hypothetical protein
MEETPKNDVEKSAVSAAKSAGNGLSTPVWAGIAVACAIVGVLIGKFLLGGVSGGALAGKTKVSESELNSAIATYTYAGATNSISVRDVITSSSSLDSAKNEDGTYNVPAADNALSVARSAIIEKEAEKRGLAVSDDDISSYAKEMLGSDDLESIASSYGMDVDTAKNLIKQSAMMKKLREQVVSDSDAGEAPTAPTKAADDQKQVPTAEYAQYIIKLAGSEWDSANNKWASTDGPYATALKDYTVTNEGATYEAAQAAYNVAYQNYSVKQSETTTQWTDFVNGLLSNASIQLSTLVA